MRRNGLDGGAGPAGIRRHRFRRDRRRPDRARDGAHARAFAVPVDRGARRQRAATQRVGGGEGQVAAAHRQRGSDPRVRHRRRPPSDRPDAGDGGEIRPGLAGHGRQAFCAGRPCGGRLCRRIAKIRGYARAVSRRGRRVRAHARRAHAGRQQARRQRRARAGAIAAGRRARRRPVDRGDARRRPRGRLPRRCAASPRRRSRGR